MRDRVHCERFAASTRIAKGESEERREMAGFKVQRAQPISREGGGEKSVGGYEGKSEERALLHVQGGLRATGEEVEVVHKRV